MAKKKKTKYTDEYKTRAVSLVISSGKTVAQIASDLGMNATTLYNWVAQVSITLPASTDTQLVAQFARALES